MNNKMPYDPGVLPTKPAPKRGEKISMSLQGFPPYKDVHFSIRNPKHRIHDRFIALRDAAITAMEGRAPYRGPIQLNLVLQTPRFEAGKSLVDYVGGVMDSLDGSHGPSFTYLPIVYEDDCQVAAGGSSFRPSSKEYYDVVITFLRPQGRCEPVA